MSFTIPSQWQVIGEVTDETGAGQIAMARPIGGGGTADGQDETTLLVQNARYSWAASNLCSLSEMIRGSSVSCVDAGSGGGDDYSTLVQAAYTNASASYVEFAQVLVTAGANRFSVVLHCDYIGQVKAEAFNAADASLDSDEVAASTSRTQNTITLDVSSETDIYIKLSAKKASSTNPQVYSVVVTESASDLSSSGTFVKIDDDAVNGLQPYDAYALQGLSENDRASHLARGRRAGWFWPTADRPTMAAAQTVVYPLAMWRCSNGCTEIKIRLRLTVADAAVNFGAAIYDVFGTRRMSSTVASTSVAVGGPKSQDLTISIPAGLYDDRDVLVCLLVRSDDTGTSTSQAYTSQLEISRPIDRRNRIDLLPDGTSSHSITLTSGKRWKVGIENNASGSNTPTDPPYPKDRTIIHEADPLLYVWPSYDEIDYDAGWARGAVEYVIRVTEIGQAKILSAHISETDFEPLSSMKDRLHPGHGVSAAAIKTLYVRQREHWLRRSKCHRAVAPGYTGSSSTPNSNWGHTSSFSSTHFQQCGHCTVRGYDAHLDNAGAVGYRSVLRVSGMFLVVAHGAPRNVDLTIRAHLYDVETKANPVTTASVTVATQTAQFFAYGGNRWRRPEDQFDHPADEPETADLVGFGHNSGRRSFHFIRGAMSLSGPAQLMPFEIFITDTRTTSNPRQLVLSYKGALNDSVGNPLDRLATNDDVTFWLASWGAWTAEQI